MMTVSAAQMGVLGEKSFVRRFEEVLIDRFPRQVRAMPRAELDEAVLAEARKALGYGMNSERAVAEFVMTAWLLGVGFDREIPAVREQLSRRDLTENQKAKWLKSFAIGLLDTLGA